MGSQTEFVERGHLENDFSEIKGSRLIAAGGGSAVDERPLLELFAAWTGESGRVLFLPIAQAGRPGAFGDCLAWGKRTLGSVGLSNLTMWTDLGAEDHAKLDEFDSVFIGGGNTYRLLHQIRESGFDAALRRYVARGGAVYGGSAGAIILSCDIDTCAHMDENVLGMSDTHALDIIHGHSVWCHYTTDDDARIADYIARTGHPVIAISERAGVSMENGTITARGYEPAVLFTKRERVEVEVGEAVPGT